MPKVSQSDVAQLIQSISVFKSKIDKKLELIKVEFEAGNQVPTLDNQLSKSSLNMVDLLNNITKNNPGIPDESISLKSSVFMMDHYSLSLPNKILAYNRELEGGDKGPLFEIMRSGLEKNISGVADNMEKLEKFSEQIKNTCNEMNDAHSAAVREHRMEEASCGNI